MLRILRLARETSQGGFREVSAPAWPTISAGRCQMGRGRAAGLVERRNLACPLLVVAWRLVFASPCDAIPEAAPRQEIEMYCSDERPR
jgi:hypothetical protein